MAEVKTPGIIVKQYDYGEGDRMLWIFTEDFGIVKAVSRGARKLKNKSGSAVQFLCYGEFAFYCGGEVWNINSFIPLESFEPIQYDFKALALCSYFAELCCILLDFNNPDILMLRLLLNTLYTCAYKKNVDIRLIKSVFELKAMSFSGFSPFIKCCQNCGSEKVSGFDIPSNGTLCKECKRASTIEISEDSLACLRYIISCDIKKMFMYSFPENVILELCYISERYVKHMLDREIKSLDYFKLL